MLDSFPVDPPRVIDAQLPGFQRGGVLAPPGVSKEEQSRLEVETVRARLAEGWTQQQALAAVGLGLADLFGPTSPVLPPPIRLPREKVVMFW